MKVKSRRKIWSIPIAALAIALMLAGALAVSSIVQAQAAKNVTGGGDVIVQLVEDGAPFTTIGIAANNATDDPPVTNGIGATEAVVAVELVGGDADLFNITGEGDITNPAPNQVFAGAISPDQNYDPDGADGPMGASAANVINAADQKAVYTFNVRIWFDA